MTLFDQIGAPFVKQAITEFYQRAFNDPIICHLFIGHDQAQLTASQIDFATSMLGGPKRYRGKSLAEAHGALKLKVTHFRRRQVIMREVLQEMQLDPKLSAAWLQLEEQLRPLIVAGAQPCNT